MMVLLENRLDALVRLHTSFPPGKEDVLLKIASAYEAASKCRVPPAFGPLPMQSHRATR